MASSTAFQPPSKPYVFNTHRTIELISTIEREQQTRLAMVRVLEEKRDTDKQSVTADEWTMLTAWKDDDEFDEDRKARIETFREEVKSWRRVKRRAPSASLRKT